MKKIKLTQNKFALVDNEDYEFLNRWKWQLWQSKLTRKQYAITSICQAWRKSTLKMHHFLLRPKNGLMVDHKNGNGLDNRKTNLRISTRTENTQNQDKPERQFYTSIYKGVYKRKDTGKWGSHIRVNKKLKRLGYFATEVEAAKAYNKAAKIYFGKFAKLNIIK